MIQIILTSHGPMAEAMISSAAMLYGEKDNVTALSLGEDDNIEEFHARMERLLHTNTGGEGSLILCDIPRGTPCNTAVRLAEEYSSIAVLAGMNMVMLLEALLCDEETGLEALAAILLESGRENLKRMLPVAQMEKDALDSAMEEEEW